MGFVVLIEAQMPGQLRDNIDAEMIVEILAHPWDILHHLNAMCAQMRRRSDPR